jgi:ubiquitin carboxyl-terminal hydrolase 10
LYVYVPLANTLRLQTGHQEDAEEFLGFFLDTLHEELLFVTDRLAANPTPATTSRSLSQGPPSPPGPKAGSRSRKGNPNGTLPKGLNGVEQDDAREVHRPLSPGRNDGPYGLGINSGDDNGWLEVGKKNKVSVTRTVSSQESAITRIFGGKLRSVLKIPGAAKDSATLEPYQHLQLEISPDHVKSVEDAIRHITHPETVSIHSTSKGHDVSATKQVFIESTPPILVLHLKRFLYDMDGGVQKSQKVIQYGSTLEIAKDVLSPTKRDGPPVRYKLFGGMY